MNGRDWEREVVEIVDRIREDVNDEDLVEELVDVVEELILTAYVKGRTNGEKSKSKNRP